MRKTKAEAPVQNIIQNCQFAAVQFDAKAVEAIRLIAEASLENARTLHRLADVLVASNVTVEAMVKIGGTPSIGGDRG